MKGQYRLNEATNGLSAYLNDVLSHLDGLRDWEDLAPGEKAAISKQLQKLSKSFGFLGIRGGEKLSQEIFESFVYAHHLDDKERISDITSLAIESLLYLDALLKAKVYEAYNLPRLWSYVDQLRASRKLRANYESDVNGLIINHKSHYIPEKTYKTKNPEQIQKWAKEGYRKSLIGYIKHESKDAAERLHEIADHMCKLCSNEESKEMWFLVRCFISSLVTNDIVRRVSTNALLFDLEKLIIRQCEEGFDSGVECDKRVYSSLVYYLYESDSKDKDISLARQNYTLNILPVKASVLQGIERQVSLLDPGRWQQIEKAVKEKQDIVLVEMEKIKKLNSMDEEKMKELAHEMDALHKASVVFGFELLASSASELRSYFTAVSESQALLQVRQVDNVEKDINEVRYLIEEIAKKPLLLLSNVSYKEQSELNHIKEKLEEIVKELDAEKRIAEGADVVKNQIIAISEKVKPYCPGGIKNKIELILAKDDVLTENLFILIATLELLIKEKLETGRESWLAISQIELLYNRCQNVDSFKSDVCGNPENDHSLNVIELFKDEASQIINELLSSIVSRDTLDNRTAIKAERNIYIIKSNAKLMGFASIAKEASNIEKFMKWSAGTVNQKKQLIINIKGLRDKVDSLC